MTIKRPLSVMVIGCLLVAAGAIGIAYHATELRSHPFRYELVWVFVLRLFAIICGAYLLRGNNWARWLALLWMGYHVVLSAFHSLGEFTFHALLFAAFAFFLFRPQATKYFRQRSS